MPLNCEEFEIKAKIRIEKELFHTFHQVLVHRIPEEFLQHITFEAFQNLSIISTYLQVA